LAVMVVTRLAPVLLLVAVVGGLVSFTRGARRCTHGAFQKLVQFAAIEPYAAALRAIVDLDALAIGQGQHGIRANRTFHGRGLRDLAIATGTFYGPHVCHSRF